MNAIAQFATWIIVSRSPTFVHSPSSVILEENIVCTHFFNSRFCNHFLSDFKVDKKLFSFLKKNTFNQFLVCLVKPNQFTRLTLELFHFDVFDRFQLSAFRTF